MHFKITHLKRKPHLPGSKELMQQILRRVAIHDYKRDITKQKVYNTYR